MAEACWLTASGVTYRENLKHRNIHKKPKKIHERNSEALSCSSTKCVGPTGLHRPRLTLLTGSPVPSTKHPIAKTRHVHHRHWHHLRHHGWLGASWNRYLHGPRLWGGPPAWFGRDPNRFQRRSKKNEESMIVKRDPGIDHLLGIEIAIAKNHLRDWWWCVFWCCCFISDMRICETMDFPIYGQHGTLYGECTVWSMIWSFGVWMHKLMKHWGVRGLPFCRYVVTVSP